MADELNARMRQRLTFPLAFGVYPLGTSQRMVWGVCPVCKVEPGIKCRPQTQTANDDGWVTDAVDGAHLGRVQAAPYRVRLEAA